MTIFLMRLVLWLGALAGLTFFWVGVMDAGEAGLKESLNRNAQLLVETLFKRPDQH